MRRLLESVMMGHLIDKKVGGGEMKVRTHQIEFWCDPTKAVFRSSWEIMSNQKRIEHCR